MHYFLSFSDTFAIFLGVLPCGTVGLARLLLGSSEQLGWREMGGGVATLIGIVLITQPSALFGGTLLKNVDEAELRSTANYTLSVTLTGDAFVD